MKVLDDYERRAEECRRLAEKADREHRAEILKIAATWAKLASERRQMLAYKAKQKPPR